MKEKISVFKQKWIHVDGALLAYVRYERIEHVKTCKNDSPKKWWQSLVKSWSHTESSVCGSLRANVVVL